MNKNLVYKLFASLVDYAPIYQSIEDLYVAAVFEDAVAKIRLQSTVGLGTFTCSPFAVDALIHLAGFMLNADLNKPPNDLHIANRLGNLHILGELTAGEEYTCYASIRERSQKNVTVCDVYVFTTDDLVALCTDIRFQRMDRDIFATMIGKDDLIVPQPLSTGQAVARLIPPRAQTSAGNIISCWASDVDTDSSSRLHPASSATSTNTLNLSGALLSAVAARSGVAVAEMESSLPFADMGVDSPMSIAIISDFRKQTGVELPAAFFSSNPTPADVQVEFGAISAPAEEVP